MKYFAVLSMLAYSTLVLGDASTVAQGQYLPPNRGGGQQQSPTNNYLPPNQNYPAAPPANDYLPPQRGGGAGSVSAPSNSYGTPITAPQSSYGAPAVGGARGGYGGGANSGYGGGQRGGQEENYGPAKYDFKYDVQDYESGNDFGHEESRNGDQTNGRYYVLLPDGRKQIVEYVADSNGYRPTIRYEQVGNGNGNNGGGAGGRNGGYDSNAQSNKFAGYQ